MTGELVVELFAGPGGWSTGLRAAGYTGRVIGIEWDLPACRTAIAAGHERICADVGTYPPERFAGADGLIASPPCQSFSRAGNRKGLNDARGELVREPLRWARALRPRWIACEQVPDVLPIWRHTAHELRALGYSTWTGVLCAADYGVPQTRERAFLIARRDGQLTLPPEPTHSQQGGDGLFGAVPRWVSMAEALGWESLDRHVVYVNGNRRNAARRPADQPAPTVMFSERSNKVDWVYERPATTVCGDARIGRPGHKDRDKGEAQFAEESVRVTVQEAAILQGFAADYPWQGTKTQQYQQVGNCVPPPLAEAILRPLLASATGERAA